MVLGGEGAQGLGRGLVLGAPWGVVGPEGVEPMYVDVWRTCG